MLEHASRSRHIDPHRPTAAAGGLRSQVPDLVHGPRELLDCRQLQQAGRRERGLASSTGGRGQASTWQLQLSYRAVRASTDEQRTGYTRVEWLSSTHGTKCHDVPARRARGVRRYNRGFHRARGVPPCRCEVVRDRVGRYSIKVSF